MRGRRAGQARLASVCVFVCVFAHLGGVPQVRLKAKRLDDRQVGLDDEDGRAGFWHIRSHVASPFGQHVVDGGDAVCGRLNLHVVHCAASAQGHVWLTCVCMCAQCSLRASGSPRSALCSQCTRAYVAYMCVYVCTVQSAGVWIPTERIVRPVHKGICGLHVCMCAQCSLRASRSPRSALCGQCTRACVAYMRVYVCAQCSLRASGSPRSALCGQCTRACVANMCVYVCTVQSAGILIPAERTVRPVRKDMCGLHVCVCV